MNKKFTEIEIQKLKDLRMSGLSATEIAIKLNRSEGSICGAISRYKIRVPIKLYSGETIRPIFNGKYQITSSGRVFNRLNEEINK